MVSVMIVSWVQLG